MEKIKISLTTFVDFVIASGTPKLTVVKKAKAIYSKDYKYAGDFWGPLRNEIIEMHRANRDKNSLDSVLMNLNDAKKKESYARNISSYKKWVGKKQFDWIGRELVPWQYENLEVKVNPELGLSVNGDSRLIKLYFKSEPLSKRRVETVLHLISKVMQDKYEGVTPSILDVPRGKLIEPTISVPDLDSLLIGESIAFSTMWNLLSSQN